MKQKTSFWDFPHWDKKDVLHESRHAHVIVSSLYDKSTYVEQLDNNTYILSGPQEALLANTHSFPLRIGLLLYHSFLSVLKTTNPPYKR